MKIPLVALSILLSGCGSTGVVKMEQDRYMVSQKNAKIGFVSAAEEKAAVYQQANDFCRARRAEVETLNLDQIPSGAFQSASATLEFRCVQRR